MSVAKQKSDYQQHSMKKAKITKNQSELQKGKKPKITKNQSELHENNCNRFKGVDDGVKTSKDYLLIILV